MDICCLLYFSSSLAVCLKNSNELDGKINECEFIKVKKWTIICKIRWQLLNQYVLWKLTLYTLEASIFSQINMPKKQTGHSSLPDC